MKDLFYIVDVNDRRMQFLLEDLKREGRSASKLSDFVKTKKNIAYCFSPAKQWKAAEIESLEDGSILAAGKIPFDLVMLLNEKNIRYVNLIADEVFTVQNSVLTAESALMLIMQNTANSIYEQKIAILGYGRLAKALARLFFTLHLDFTIATDQAAEAASARLFCSDVLKVNENYRDYDVIINTIPAKLLTDKTLGSIPEKTLFLELASVPAIIDADIMKYRLQYIKGLGLPGLYTPQSAARLIKEVLDRNL